MDGDGDLDVVAVSFNTGAIVWHENAAGPSFSRTHAVNLDYGERTWAAALPVDVDGDGDVDVVATSKDTGLTLWFENADGNGTFTDASMHLAAFGTVATHARACDFDGDGDVDLLVPMVSTAVSATMWLENTDGKGTFTERTMPPPSESLSIAAVCADVDGDGDQDVLGVAFPVVGSGHLVWLENTDGRGTLGAIIQLGPVEAVQALAAADLDGDQDVDLATAANALNQVAWYEAPWRTPASVQWYTQLTQNLSSPDAASGPQLVAEGVWKVLLADVDADGWLDLVTLSGPVLCEVVWHRNAHNRSFEQPVSVTFATVVLGATAADVDADGDVDVVLVTDEAIAWYANTDGQGDFALGQAAAVVVEYPGLALDVQVADLDGDRLLDVLWSDYLSGRIVFQRNPGRGAFNASAAPLPVAAAAATVRRRRRRRRRRRKRRGRRRKKTKKEEEEKEEKEEEE